MTLRRHKHTTVTIHAIRQRAGVPYHGCDREELSEHDDVRLEDGVAAWTGRRRPVAKSGDDLFERDALAAHETAGGTDGAVDLEHLLGSGGLVQAVDVLGHDRFD